MDLQTQPDPFQSQLDWCILLSCSELLPPEISRAGYERCYMGQLSLFQLSWEFNLSSLLLKCDRAKCGPQVALSLYWGWAPRGPGHFLKTHIRQKCHICMHDPLYPCFHFWLHPLLGYRNSCNYFSVFAFCVVFFPSFWGVSTRFREEVVHGKKKLSCC